MRKTVERNKLKVTDPNNVIECDYCKVQFTPRAPKQKFCCAHCRADSHRYTKRVLISIEDLALLNKVKASPDILAKIA